MSSRASGARAAGPRGRSRLAWPGAAVAALLALVVAPVAYAVCTANVDLTTPDSDLIDNGDETITHTKTGLMWKQCSEGNSGVNCLTGITTGMTWTQAQAAVTAANAGKFAGHGDWRLPNVKELQSLVESGCYLPSINTTRFPNTVAGEYWTGTSYAFAPVVAWTTSFGYGTNALADKTGALRPARLVRTGKAFGAFDATAAPSTTASDASPTGGGQVTASIAGGGAACAFGDARFVRTADAPTPAGVAFPYGAFAFSTYGCTVGGSVTFTMTYPATLPAGSLFWAYGPTPGDPAPHWYILPATISGNQVQFSIVDGQLGDDDRAANGFITGQGGPAYPDGSVVFTLDVDANNAYDPLTDGVIVTRYVVGSSGAALVNGALGFGANRTDPTTMLGHLNDIRPRLDADGNGHADAVDATLVLRYLFGYRGDALIAGALGAGATRTTAAAVEAYIQTLLP